jgi:hypothetical protein
MQFTEAEAPAKKTDWGRKIANLFYSASLFRPQYTELEKGTYLPTKLMRKSMNFCMFYIPLCLSCIFAV